MTNPTPEQITEAITVLRAVPGLSDNDTLAAVCPRTGLAPGAPAIVHVSEGSSESWPLVERVHGGWQSGAHHYPDAAVVSVRPYTPPARVVAEGDEVEAIAVEWMRYVGFTAEQIAEAEAQSCSDTCERAGDAWDCTDENGDSVHPVADELAASVAMANVAMATLESRGWRPPAHKITTPAELDALPVYTVGTVGEGVAAQRWPDGWNVNGQHAGERSGSDELIEECGPVTIVYVPTEEAPRG